MADVERPHAQFSTPYVKAILSSEKRRETNTARGLCEKWFTTGGPHYRGPSPEKKAASLKAKGRPLFRCGKCEPCLGVRADDWSGRMMAEVQTAMRVVMLTLTYQKGGKAYGYSNDNRAKNLMKTDYQNLVKRMRKQGYIFRYFVAGEIGPTRGRAHWHLILFLHPDSKAMPREFELGYNVWPTGTPLNDRLPKRYQDIWLHGHLQMKDITSRQATNYALKYLRKAEHESVYGYSQGIGSEYVLTTWLKATINIGAPPSYGTFSVPRDAHEKLNGKPTWKYRMSPYLSAKFANAFVELWDKERPNQPLPTPRTDWLFASLARYDRLFGEANDNRNLTGVLVKKDRCRKAVKPMPTRDALPKDIAHLIDPIWSETTQTWCIDDPITQHRYHYTYGSDMKLDWYRRIHGFHRRRLQQQQMLKDDKNNGWVASGPNTEQRIVSLDLPDSDIPKTVIERVPHELISEKPLGDLPHPNPYPSERHARQALRDVLRRMKSSQRKTGDHFSDSILETKRK